MRFKIVLLILTAGAGSLVARDPALKDAPYLNAALPVEERVNDLISRMTFAEKVGQLISNRGYTTYEIRNGEVFPSKELKDLYAKYPGACLWSFARADWYTGRNWKTGLTPDLLVKGVNMAQREAVERTRLGIPIRFDGAIHGLQVLGGLILPSGLGQAATFDRAIVKRGGSDTVEELLTYTQAGRVPGPTQDLARDPRFSRREETYGEDPYLASELGYAYGMGIWERGDGNFGVAPRHFPGHGEGEGGQMAAPVHIGRNEMLNVILRAYEGPLRAHPAAVMTCYNLIDGIPGAIHGEFINGWLRGKMGFDGVIVGDAGAIGNLVAQGVAADLGEAAALFVKNGSDMCCWEAETYRKGLELAFKRGLLTEKDLEPSLRRVLRGKFRAGLFEHPYIEDETGPVRIFACHAHRQTALEMARRGMTLLKNEGGVLPFDSAKVRRLAVIGPNADKATNQIGDYTAPVRPGFVVTPRMGFEDVGRELGVAVEYARGCGVRSLDRSGFAEALSAARRADAIVLCLGGSSVPDMSLAQNEAGTALANEARENLELDKDSGEGYDRARLRLGGVQLELLKEVVALGKPTVTVLIMGRAMVLNEVDALSKAMLLAWYPGMEGGRAIAETVFGLVNPAGRLPVSFPKDEGALPCYYNRMCESRGYVDVDDRVVYPFGFGLSYTRFAYGEPSVRDTDGTPTLEVAITNVGGRDGEEVVQLYIKDIVADVALPIRSLRGFERVFVRRGATNTVRFPLTAKELGYWNRKGDYVVEPGDFDLSVGGSSAELKTVRWTLERKD